MPEKLAAPLPSQKAEQSEILAFLASPEAYPGQVREVKRIDTHAASVFLAGNRAYKIKRAVRLPYLDFSTVPKRRAALLHELEINSKISPELYLEVVPITYDAKRSSLRLGGEDEALDWVLVMRRFDEDGLFDDIAAKGPLKPTHVTQIAGLIKQLHEKAIVDKSGGWLARLTSIMNDLEGTLTGGEARSIELTPGSFISRLRRELGHNVELIAVRERAGFVRRCHGDLHLGNIVLWQGEPKLFDAIEFDDKLATIDVLYDLAFLLMDLWRRGRKREANAVFNRYLRGAAPADLEGLALLPLFLSMRAAIRAMTGLHGLALRQGPDRDKAILAIRGYALLAESFLNRAETSLVAVGGLSGTGKTTVAQEIAPSIGTAPGALHLRTDVERKLMRGGRLTKRLPLSFYSPESSTRTYRQVFKKAEIAIRAGQSVVMDAVFPNRSQRAQARRTAGKTDVGFFGFWLLAPAEQMRKRLAARKGDASDADASVLARQEETIKPPLAWTIIDASGSASEAAAAISSELASDTQPKKPSSGTASVPEVLERRS